VQIGVFALGLWFGTHRLDQAVSIRSVRVELPNQSGIAVIVIEASGALPAPTSGRASDPARIYLDFPNVLPLGVVEPVSTNPLLTRIRVAQHSASPLVTRLVLDLIQETTYRIDVSARTEGRVVVLLRAESFASSPPRVSGTPADMQYTLHVSATLVRLDALRPLLEAIDRRTATLPGDLDAALKESDDAAKLLTTIKPPSSRSSTHALLLRTCTLAARAVRLRQSAIGQDSASSWEAASAAAGALLMLDRASADLVKK
jgi:AMIN domain-containing protein